MCSKKQNKKNNQPYSVLISANFILCREAYLANQRVVTLQSLLTSGTNHTSKHGILWFQNDQELTGYLEWKSSRLKLHPTIESNFLSGPHFPPDRPLFHSPGSLIFFFSLFLCLSVFLGSLPQRTKTRETFCSQTTALPKVQKVVPI